MKLPYKLVCIDLETTDLNPEIGSIIQIGSIIIDENFEIDSRYGQFNEYIKPLDDHRNKKAMEVNQISEEILNDAMSLNEVLELFENFVGENIILAAWGTYFDIPFLRAQYNKINRKWPFNHKWFDLKTIGIWEMSKKDTPMSESLSKFLEVNNLEFEGNTHDALNDIKSAVKLLSSFK